MVFAISTPISHLSSPILSPAESVQTLSLVKKDSLVLPTTSQIKLSTTLSNKLNQINAYDIVSQTLNQ